jgi:hypothetical protein
MQQESTDRNRIHEDPGATAASIAVPAVASLKPLTKRIEENTTIFSQFNVMPGRPVEETLFVKEYRINDRYIEATFDRQYKSSMLESPDHLIFLTALAQAQKLLYVLLCHEFGLDYDPYQDERLKIWPTKLHINLPKMVTKTTDLVQTMTIKKLEKASSGKYYVHLSSAIEHLIEFEVETVVYLL